MPAGIGLLQIVRKDQENTYANLTCVPSDGYAGCKVYVEFTAEIKSSLTDGYVNWGQCQIIRQSDGQLILS